MEIELAAVVGVLAAIFVMLIGIHSALSKIALTIEKHLIGN